MEIFDKVRHHPKSQRYIVVEFAIHANVSSIPSYGGADQWQLEGVQPGGIRSGGIFGLWTHCDHEESSPVGPFCYFPLELCCKIHSFGT